jgi:hypothetical protein
MHWQVLSMKHEEQLSHLSSSTTNLELALHSIRKSVNFCFLIHLHMPFRYLFGLTDFFSSSSCECPDTSTLERNLVAATARIAELEAHVPRIAELQAAAVRLAALEAKVSLLMAAASLPSDPQ